mgnify:CR=1 FL=1
MRGRLTIQKAAEDDFAKLNDFTTQNLRKITDGSQALDPMCLNFFIK